MSEQERDFLDEYRDQDAAASGTENESCDDETIDEEAGTAEQTEAATTATEPEAPAAPDAQKDGHVPYAAMKAERDKRQERERELQERDRRLADMERQIQELRNPSQQHQPKPVEIWEDPDAFINQRLQSVEQQSTNRLYAALEAQARETYPDYDEVFAVVQEHAKTNPTIGPQVLSAPNPALAAYKLGKQLREAKQMEDPVAYRARLEAEIRAQIASEAKASAEVKRKAAAAIPPDLSASRNVAGNAVPVADDFDTLFPRN